MNTIKMVSTLSLLTLLVGCSTQKATPNKDSLHSLFEVNQHISQTLFKYIDRDKDAKISQNEFITYTEEKNQLQEQKHIQLIIASCDKNGDQQISLDEIPKRNSTPEPYRLDGIEPKMPCFISPREFARKDSNHDERLTSEELLASNNLPPYPRAEEVNTEERNIRREAVIKKHYERCDQNSDGKLTLKEATTTKCRMPSEVFTQTDTNNDNFVSLEEVMKSTEEQYNHSPVMALPVQTLTPVELPSSMPIEIRMMIKMPQCDSNKDQKIDEKEALSCGFSKKIFQESDLNKDGFFSQEDMKSLNTIRRFKRIDRDNNGYIDLNEFQQGDRVFQPPY